jgi:FkbM family methyltransferase
MDRTVKHGSRILDIGANIGYYVLIEANLVGSSGQIVAVEPSPTNIDLLRKNIQLNGLDQVTVVEGAVSNSGGIQKFFLAEESNLNTFHREILEIRNNLKGELDVQVFTVRELTKLYGSFDYIRMDIEGHEVQVLEDIVVMSNEGCRKLPDIIFETHINAYSKDQDIGKVLQAIERIGYQIEFVATSSERGTKLLEQHGSFPEKVIRTDEVYRSIHNDIEFPQLICCLEETGGIRTVYLKCRPEISLAV